MGRRDYSGDPCGGETPAPGDRRPASGGEAGRAFLYREESAGPGRVGSGLRRARSDQVRGVQAMPAAPGALRRHCLLLGCRDLQEIEANILLPDWCGEQPAQHLGPGRV